MSTPDTRHRPDTAQSRVILDVIGLVMFLGGLTGFTLVMFRAGPLWGWGWLSVAAMTVGVYMASER